MPKAHELPLLLAPEVETKRFEARPERDRGHLLKPGVLVVALLQRVVRDARAEMVNMVQPDIAGEPLQHFRQLEVGAAAQRGGGIIPVAMALPVSTLELVLDVEHPDPAQARYKGNRQLDHEVSLNPDRRLHHDEQRQDEDVAEVDTEALALARDRVG